MGYKYTERICLHDEQFMIERVYPKQTQKPTEYLPLSQWGFQKNVTGQAIVRRETENLESLDEPQHVTFYEIAISWKVLEESPLSKPIFLKSGEFVKVISEQLRAKETYCRVYVKNMENSIMQEAQYFDSASFPFNMVKVTKSRPKRITIDEAKALVKSGKCLGIFNDKELTEQVV